MLRNTVLRRRILLGAALLPIVVAIVTFGTLRGGSSTRPGSPLEVELITLLPGGFEPSELVRYQDLFVLFVDDRSGKENTSLVLQRVNGERLRPVNLNRKKSQWHDVVDLSPGTYVLQDANNAELRCQITILP